ncbi:hypothetical protein LRAMOSA08784 [Lichtheimia ramosa]|uniref:Uncharacterized protein n=1 Tax=Lichtheimia ramosa TaxID=688394 RepID=A0A077WF34_9FUNG|nr:hypothetical protein LRAMOSA08784 [Lichtheimia ramosa]
MSVESCPATFEGVEYIRWIHTIFGDCVYGWQDCFSWALGYISILCWLNAQMPQVIKNYRYQDAESLSFSFLTVWLSGDVANFIGCIYTGQLNFQVYLSIYFIFIDTLLCFQWLYYVKYPNNRLRQWFNPTLQMDKEQLLKKTTADDGTTDIARYGSVASSSRTLLMAGLLFTLTRMASPEQSVTLTTNMVPSHDTMNGADMSLLSQDDDTLWMGRFFAWLCTCLYLSSRAPQIIKNYKRQSVEGLAMALFMCAAAGNFTYTLGVFTNPHQTRQSLLESVPYIIGSAGTLVFDLTIYIQYRLYNNDTQEKNVERVLQLP